MRYDKNKIVRVKELINGQEVWVEKVPEGMVGPKKDSNKRIKDDDDDMLLSLEEDEDYKVDYIKRDIIQYEDGSYEEASNDY